jgi:hypothetical protein
MNPKLRNVNSRMSESVYQFNTIFAITGSVQFVLCTR